MRSESTLETSKHRMQRLGLGAGPMALALLVTTAGAAGPASGQRSLSTVVEDFSYVFDDMVHIWAAPFRMDGDDVAPVGLVLGGTGLVMLADESVQDWVRDHRDGFVGDVFHPFGEESATLARAGDTEHLLQFSAATYLLGFALDSRDLREAATGCIAADYANSLSRHVVYEAIARTRPSLKLENDQLVQVDDAFDFGVPGGGWNEHSFFGGHAANIMSCVSFWNNRFDLGAAEPVLWAVAGGVGLARTVDERHWLSDTLLGMVFGWAIGREVAERHQRRELRREAAEGAGGAGAAAAPRGEGVRLPLVGFVPGAPLTAVGPGPAGERTYRLGWQVRF